ncbi:MAG: gliding motility lipoprotein GldD [Bacteroidia bacterium]|nr:gliding motility lipoprotein GldD [Bacteroidia bacterium]
MRFNVIISIALLITVFSGCGSSYTPKPHGYPKIEFPEKSYVRFNDNCAYSFEIPTYAVVRKDTHMSAEPCWYDITFPQFHVTVYLSYKGIRSQAHLDTLSEEAYKLAMKNNIKADVIDEQEIFNPKTGNSGMIYELFGPSATPYNFYVTDDSLHYVRGSFYFDQHTKTDSVAPVYEFLKEDLKQMINTLTWK